MNDPLSAFLRYLALERDASPHTLRSYRSDLAEFGRFVGPGKALDAVDARTVRGYLAHLHARRLEPASVGRKLAALRSWFRFLVRRGALQRNAAREVRGPRVPKTLVSFLPIDEATALVEGKALRGTARPRDLAILELLYASGLRVSELAALTLDAVDRAGRTVRVLGKGRKERIVPFGAKAARALEAYLADRAATRGPLFTNHRGGRLTPRAIPAGNKPRGGSLSLRWKQAEAPVGPAERGDPVSSGFSDQLVAVLPRLRRFARGLAGSASEADDLVQAACERALAREHQFQEGTRFDSWMFRIVQTIWIDQLRARDVRKEGGDVEDERMGSDAAVRSVEARLALAEVRRAVQHLPAEQRNVLMLVTVEGLSYKEAAEVAGVPVGTIMSRLARARIALQQQLDSGAGVRRSATDAEAQ